MGLGLEIKVLCCVAPTMAVRMKLIPRVPLSMNAMPATALSKAVLSPPR